MTRPHLDNFAKSMIATGALVLPVALLAPAATAAPALAKGCKAQKITWQKGQSLSSFDNGYIMLHVPRDHAAAAPGNSYKASKQTHWTTLTVVLQDGTVKVSRYHHGGIQGGTLTNPVVKATLVGIGCGARGVTYYH